MIQCTVVKGIIKEEENKYVFVQSSTFLNGMFKNFILTYKVQNTSDMTPLTKSH